MAFAHVDDAVRLGGIEANHGALPDLQCLQRRSAAAVRRRQIGRPDFGRQVVLRQRCGHARDEIAAIGLIVGMLELAAAAFREMLAGRLLVMGTEASAPSSSTASPGTPNGTWRPLGVTPSPRAAIRTITSFTARDGAGDRPSQVVGDQSGPGDLGGTAVQPDAG